MQRISVDGVVVGGISSVVAAYIFTIPINIYLASAIGVLNAPDPPAGAAVATALHAHPVLYALQILIGLVCSVLGGYVAARLARNNELRNGALSAWLCVEFGIYAALKGTSHDSVPIQIAFLIASPAAGLLGGYLRLKRAKPVAA